MQCALFSLDGFMFSLWWFYDMILIFCIGSPSSKKEMKCQVKMRTSLKGKHSCYVRQYLTTFPIF